MKIMHDPAPSLPPNQGFSEEFQSFINVCLEKDLVKRPKFDLLLVSLKFCSSLSLSPPDKIRNGGSDCNEY